MHWVKIETETCQPGVIQDKLKENHTYLVATNYWTPLDNKDDKNEEDEEEANMLLSTPAQAKQKSNKWMRQITRRKQQKIIIDSGAISHFMSKDLNLPTEGASYKSIFLPDKRQLQMPIKTSKTKLPFDNMSDTA